MMRSMWVILFMIMTDYAIQTVNSADNLEVTSVRTNEENRKVVSVATHEASDGNVNGAWHLSSAI